MRALREPVAAKAVILRRTCECGDEGRLIAVAAGYKEHILLKDVATNSTE
jgi:hypothetical protein